MVNRVWISGVFGEELDGLRLGLLSHHQLDRAELIDFSTRYVKPFRQAIEERDERFSS